MGCRWMGVVEGECRLGREEINMMAGVSRWLIRKDRRQRGRECVQIDGNEEGVADVDLEMMRYRRKN
jgi:ABC-type ATPase with predicted acetyltransferase domain